MALSFSTHTYAGGVRTFPISFALGSGDRANVAVYVIGELDGAGDQLYRDFTWNRFRLRFGAQSGRSTYE